MHKATVLPCVFRGKPRYNSSLFPELSVTCTNLPVTMGLLHRCTVLHHNGNGKVGDVLRQYSNREATLDLWIVLSPDLQTSPDFLN